MKYGLIFAASLALAAAPVQDGAVAPLPEWVHLVPYGRWEGMGPGGAPLEIGEERGRQLVANFRRGRQDLPIDWEHQTMLTEQNGQPAPAAGWIDLVELRADGVWGHVREWTPRAADQLRAREYRFFSPVILFTSRDRKTNQPIGWALGPGALTNHPFFGGDLQPLMASSSLGADMDLLAKIIELLGLPPETTPEQALAAVQERCAAPADAAAMKAAAALGGYVAGVLGWSAALPADAQAQVKARLEAKAGVDPVEHLTALREIETLKAKGSQPDLEKRGLEAGKLTPGMVGTFRLLLATKGHAAAAAWLDAAPVTVAFGSQADHVAAQRAAEAGTLSPEEHAACAQMGISPKDYLAAKAKS